MSKTQETVTVELPTIQQLLERIVTLETMVAQLVAPRATQQREMTDADARSILIGEYRHMKHNECAAKLGLSYGQVYSCRHEYTFRHIHASLKTMIEYSNIWKK